ncbi:MAG: hypothetical protein JW909_08530 [Planctomycetes bacterium]|nr:hypothetical protein [Planctomycetota bacterium]
MEHRWKTAARRGRLAVLVLGTLIFHASRGGAVEWNLREFGCSYRLDDDTGWAELPSSSFDPSVRFAALRTDQKISVALTVKSLPGKAKVGPMFVKAFEDGMLRGNVRKLSGRYMTFADVPAYEVVAEGPVENSVMRVHCRTFMANGHIYALSVYSYDMVPEDAELEKLFSGYSWLSPPVVGGSGPNVRLILLAGAAAAVLVLVASIIAAVLALKKK